MSCGIVGEFTSDVGRFLASVCLPNQKFENDHNLRKLSIGFGIAGVVAALAMQLLGATYTAAATLAGSAMLILGGITAVPLFSVLPVIALTLLAAVTTDYSRVYYVYHINPRW